MKNIAVIGAGIIGICSAYFLQKSGFKVTLVDHNKPGTMTSYGHACTFADYACIPVNSPTIFKDLPSLLLKQNGPLAVDFKYILKNFPWALSFLKNCSENDIKKMDMTTFFSKLISNKFELKGLPINGSWVEIDSTKDIKLYEKLLKIKDWPHKWF